MTATWTNGTLHASSFTNQTPSVGVYDFLLMENGSYLLLETGDKMILDQSNPAAPTWTNGTKN